MPLLTPYIVAIAIGIFVAVEMLPDFYCPLWLFVLQTVLTLVLIIVGYLRSKRFTHRSLLWSVFSYVAIVLWSATYCCQRRVSDFGAEGEEEAFISGQLTERVRVNKRSVTWHMYIDTLAMRRGIVSNICGHIVFPLDSVALSFSPGDYVELRTRAVMWSRYMNSDVGVYDYGGYLEKHGVEFVARRVDVQSVERGKQLTLRMTTRKWADRAVEVLGYCGVSDSNMNVLRALIFGDKSMLTKSQKESFVRCGTAHILAVSGMHVGVVYGIVYMLLLVMRINHYKWANLIILVAVWLYALMTGLSPSVCRAALMLSFISVGALVGRKGSGASSLMFALLILMLVNPYVIFDLGMWLSFGSVMALVHLMPPVEILILRLSVYMRVHYGFKVSSFIEKWFLRALALSVICQLATLPLQILMTNQLPVFFFLNNLVMLPLLTPLLGFSIVAIVLYGFAPMFANWAATATNYIMSFLDWYVSWAKELPQLQVGSIGFSTLESIFLFVSIMMCCVCFGAEPYMQWVNKGRRRAMSLMVMSFLLYAGTKVYLDCEMIGKEELSYWRVADGSVGISYLNNGAAIHWVSDTTDIVQLERCEAVSRAWRVRNEEVRALENVKSLNGVPFENILQRMAVYDEELFDKQRGVESFVRDN
ncbi:MAG: ComEC/Rec2 family competence protein [Marinilabiliaceae bacterium]|nr:ComEC/Rec2 family competence protein [Marinilabiliaceae bacterium]